jgi:beta-lactamase regulating signal transducer with metallopeptidase domain/protocatechuate 3,4-dioxygenase beta subunit
MNRLAALDPGPGGLALALHVATQVAAVALVAGVLVRVACRRRAASRHAVWLCALLCILASAPLTRGLARSGRTLVSLPRPWPVAAPVPAGSPREVGPPAVATPGALAERSATPPVAAVSDETPPDPAMPAPPTPDARPEPAAGPTPRTVAGGVAKAGASEVVRGGITAMWFAGMALLSARLAWGAFVLRRLGRRSRVVDSPSLEAARDAARRRLGGVANLPPVRVATGLRGPVLAGFLRPTVLVPPGLLAESRSEDLEDVLVHEGAHAIRRDPWVSLLQHVAGVAFWPHPLVHLVNRRLTRAREEVCDDHVLAGRDARAYARTLLNLSLDRPEPRSALSLGLLDRGWTLEDRVTHLLDPRRIIMTRVGPGPYLAIGAALLAAGVAVAGVRLDDAAPVDAPAPATPPAPPDPSGDRVSGVVVDAAGNPVAGARVILLDSRKRIAEVVTGADGAFAFNVPAGASRYATAHATADGGAIQALARGRGGDFTDPEQVCRLTLRPARSLTARVRDRDGRPVPGATVEVLDRYGPFAHAQTDAEGDARFRVPPDLSLLWTTALKAGVGFDYAENYRSWPGDDDPPLPDAVELTLAGARTVRVRAVDPAGAPVAGVEFAPWYFNLPGKIAGGNVSGSATTRATTDAEGVATFTWIPGNVQTRIQFNLRSDTHSLRERVVVPGGSADVEAKAVLLRNGTLSGRVTDADGAPVAGVLVLAEGKGNSPDYGRRLARTRADGTYSATVPPLLHYMVGVVDRERAAPSRTGILVGQGAKLVDLDFRLGGGATLRGRVTIGPDRRPAGDKSITLIERGEPFPQAGNRREPTFFGAGEEELVRWARTDAEGRYELRIGPGTYRLSGPDVAARDRKDLTVRDGEELVRDYHLEAPDRSELTGTVVVAGPGGKPVAGAIVRSGWVAATGHGGFTAMADDQGRFRVERWSDETVVNASSPDGTLAAIVELAADRRRLDLALTPAASVRGRVVDRDGRPLAGMAVGASWGLSPTDRRLRTIDAQTTTDAEGRYELGGFAVGSHGQVMVMAEDLVYSPATAFSAEKPGPLDLPDVTAPGR